MTTLENAFKNAVARVTDERGKPAVLGKTDGTLYWVDPSGMTHRTRVWARVGEQSSNQEVVVDCIKVPPQIDMPVRVDYVNGSLSVVDVDYKRAVEFGGGRPPGSGGAHAWMHSRLGPDPVFIEGLQYLPLLVTPTNPADLTVTVQAGAYYDLAGDLQVFDTAVSGSTSAYVPVSDYHFVIICLDRSDGSIAIVDGDDITATDALFSEVAVTAADIEAITISDDYWPLAVVLLGVGQTQIKAKDIVRDLRPASGGAAGGAPGGADTQVQFNDGGSFGGDDAFTWDKTNNILTLTKTAVATPPTFDADAAFVIENGYVTFSQAAGEQFGLEWYVEGQTGEQASIEYNGTNLRLQSSAQIDFIVDSLSVWKFNAGDAETVFNFASADINFRVEGDTATNLVVVDAGLNAFRVGTTVAGALLDVAPTGIIFNNAEADIDIRWAGNGVTNGYYYDAGNNRHGFGTGTPQRTVHIIGPDGPVASFPASFGAADSLVFENNGNSNMGLVASAAATSVALKMYKSGGTAHTGLIGYSMATDAMIFQTAQTLRLTIDGVGNIQGNATTGTFIINSLTTTQRDALTAVNGMILYNSTTSKIQARAGGAWVDLH